MNNRNNDMASTVIEKIKENYVSALIGLIIFVLGIGFVANSLSGDKKEGSTGLSGLFSNSKDEVEAAPDDAMAKQDSSSYTVKKGDTLWSIAEGRTGSGYNYVDIVAANKLKNANTIEVGQKLMIPDMKAMKKTVMEQKGNLNGNGASTAKITITGDSYTVVAGDTLWSISLRAYGTGYKWAQIAKANGLKNANVIEKGQKLKLMR